MGCVCNKYRDNAMPRMDEDFSACVLRGCSQNVQKSPLVRQPYDPRRNVLDATCRSRHQRSRWEHIRVHSRREFLGDAERVTRDCDDESPGGEEERHLQVILREGLMEVHCILVGLQ